jgi:hypothetical protein
VLAPGEDEAHVMEFNVAPDHHSKRFHPTTFTEKIVPVLLVVLLIALVAVLVITGLSLTG